MSKDDIQIFMNVPIKLASQRSKFLNLARNMFSGKDVTTYLMERHKRPSLYLQLSNSIFQSLYLSLFENLKENLLQNKKYRISFLKGLFAAEGHVKHSVYGTIESIQFAFNPKEELPLARFVKKLLKIEGIESKIDKKGSLYLLSYEYMLKLFLLDITDVHRDKRDKFLRLIKNIRVIIYLEKYILGKVKIFSQEDISRSLGVSQSLIPLWLKEGRIELESLKRLFPLFGMTREQLIEKIKYIRISGSKVMDKESIKFLLASHNFNKDYRIKLQGKRSNLTVQAKLYLILNSIFESEISGEVTSKDLIKYYNYSRIGVVQWLQRLRSRGFAEIIGKGYNNIENLYKLTKEGKETHSELNERYEIVGKIY